MKPAKAREYLQAVQGQMLHVYCGKLSCERPTSLESILILNAAETDPSGRVSYKPYRKASQQLVALLRSLLEPDDVIEVAR
jgi:hypothetical protein